MKYYEIWFYYYDWYDTATNTEKTDERTDYEKEFTFYCKTNKLIETDEDMINHLKSEFPMTDKLHSDQVNCIDHKHYEHMSRWFEISAEEFTTGCGVPA